MVRNTFLVGVVTVVALALAAWSIARRESAYSNEIGNIEIALDCDVETAGVQSECAYASGTTNVDVAVVVRNIGTTTTDISAFNFEMVSGLVLQPAYVTSDNGQPPDGGRAANPDFNDAALILPYGQWLAPWACTPPRPVRDLDPSAAVARSFLSCFNAGGGSPILRPGDGIQIASTHYLAGEGTQHVRIEHLSVGDAGGVEIASCDNGGGTTTVCGSAMVTVGDRLAEPPTVLPPAEYWATWTPCADAACSTNTPTNTPTATATPTPYLYSGFVPPVGGHYAVLDCDVAAPGVQSQCTVPWDAEFVDIALNFGIEWPGTEWGIRWDETYAFDARILSDGSVFSVAPGLDRNKNGNPNLLEPGTTWSCQPPGIEHDASTDPLTIDSRLGCYSWSGEFFRVPWDGAVPIAVLRLGVMQTDTQTTVALESVYSDNLYCEPNHQPERCIPAVITLGSPPPPTPEATPSGFDADADGIDDVWDNCASTANASQSNLDSEWQYVASAPYQDRTNPGGDAMGDPCDIDQDGDRLANANEMSSGASPLYLDTDGDGVPDASEAGCGSDPRSATSKPSGPDLDGDRLPDACEATFGADPTLRDTDNDGVTDGVEVAHWATDPAAADSDGDGCHDATEIATMNADRSVNAIDLSQTAIRFGWIGHADRAFDMNGDGSVNAIDLSFVARNFGPCNR